MKDEREINDVDKRDGPSALALQKVAVAWCADSTSHKEMDSVLAIEFARILDKYIEALEWCSGSADFGFGGKARKGWENIAASLLDEVTPGSDEEG